VLVHSFSFTFSWNIKTYLVGSFLLLTTQSTTAMHRHRHRLNLLTVAYFRCFYQRLDTVECFQPRFLHNHHRLHQTPRDWKLSVVLPCLSVTYPTRNILVPTKRTMTSTDTTTIRDPSNGVKIHREGTEQNLLDYVRHQLGESNEQQAAQPTPSITHLETLLGHVDTFCMSRHWMMHIGPEKGKIMESFLTECCQEKWKLVETAATKQKQTPLLIVEIGTYCGYSLIRMAKTILSEHSSSRAENALPFHIFTVDISAENQAVAKEMAKLAGVDNHVSFLLLKGNHDEKELQTLVKSAVTQKFPDASRVDFLFIDHDKDLYLPDLLQMEQTGLIRAGTFVCADNVFHFRLDEYRQHMADLAATSPDATVRTRLEMSSLEYVNEVTKQQEAPDHDLRDGLELTVFLKDPPVLTQLK